MEITDKTPKASTAGRRRGAVGRPSVDVQRLARAISGPGLDTRQWLAVGTVGLINEDGDFVTNDRESVFVDQLGAVVTVMLEPSGRIIHARWNGIGCGRFGFMLFPLVPGDEVLVMIPNGDLNSSAISVVTILSNQTARIPKDWNNNEVRFELNVPLVINGKAGIEITSTNLSLNGRKVSFSPEGI